MVAELEVVTGRKSGGDVRPRKSGVDARPGRDGVDVPPRREAAEGRRAEARSKREKTEVRPRRDKAETRTTRDRTETRTKRDKPTRDRAETRPKRDKATRPKREAADVPLDEGVRQGEQAEETASTSRVVGTGAARARVSAARTPRTPFVLLILALLGGALVSLLLLNTVLAQDAFTLTELQQSNKQLKQQQQSLQEDIAREEAPANLAQKAKALGMIQPNRPAFVDLRTGQVVGGSLRPVPRAAAAAAGAAGVLGVPGAVVPGDGIPGWTGGEPAEDPKITTPGEGP